MVEAGRRDDTFGAPARGARKPITLRDYNAFCASLPATTFVEQWGDAQVWKVGGKMFACAWFEKGHHPWITFKVSDIGWEVLKDAPGCRGAPYYASRGMKWIQSYDQPGLSKSELKEYLRMSHQLVAAGLPKRLQKELEL